MNKKIKVHIVDDSAFMRRELKSLVDSDPELEVVACSRDGKEALEHIEKFSPDVVTLDINMPVMDGLTCLAHITENYDVPVLMLSSLTHQGELSTFEALELGAVDFVGKPGGSISKNIWNLESEIIFKIKAAANSKLFKKKTNKSTRRSFTPSKSRRDTSTGFRSNSKVVVIGMSTGGPRTIFDVLPLLPEKFNFSIVVVQHMPAAFTAGYAERIAKSCAFPFALAKSGDELKAGRGYLAPGGLQLTFQNKDSTNGNKYFIRLSRFPSDTEFIPSVDICFQSAAKVFTDRCIGLLMTGMGSDGAQGIATIKDSGGTTFSESEETCVVYGMPRAAEATGKVDYVLPSYEIADALLNYVERRKMHG